MGKGEKMNEVFWIILILFLMATFITNIVMDYVLQKLTKKMIDRLIALSVLEETIHENKKEEK